MKSIGKNRMESHFMELAGLRMVKMYVTEFFHWGYQEIDQQNDDGLDGIIMVRDKAGYDMGVRIHCQIKCGPAYEKSSTDTRHMSVLQQCFHCCPGTLILQWSCFLLHLH